MQTNYSRDKLKVSKSKSTSLIIKQKIGIALGKITQSQQTTVKKPTQTSYLGRQRSNSLKSLPKTSITTSRGKNSIDRKLDFNENNKIQNQSQSSQSSKKQKSTSNNNSSLYHDKQNNNNSMNNCNDLIWIDSYGRKLQKVDKKTLTIGQNNSQFSLQLSINSEVKQQPLLKIKDNFLSILMDLKVFVAKFDSKIKKKEIVGWMKPNKALKMQFKGFFFLCYRQDLDLPKSVQMFNFIVDQMQKLHEDGLKQFKIVSKIAKRLFESKFDISRQKYFVLLLNVQNQTKDLKTQKKIIGTQQLISHKLLCIEKTIEVNLGKLHQKLKFNKKKFIDIN